MERTLIVFSDDEVIVADAAAGSHRTGTMKLGPGYERAVTADGELMFAVVPRRDEKLIASLAVPIREVAPGAVLIEAVPTEDGGNDAGTSQRDGRDYVVIATFDRVFVIAADATGTFTETVPAPGGHVHVDSSGELVYAAFRYDAEEDWWSWLQQRDVSVYPSLRPPLLYVQHVRFPLPGREVPSSDDGPGDRPRSTVSSWVSVYDGPRRSVVITAVQSPGRHWTDLRRSSGSSDEFVLWVNDAGEVVVVELTLDDRGIPVSAPPGMNLNLLGSMTLWPRPDLHFVWWHDDTHLFPGHAKLLLEDLIEAERGEG